MRGVLTGTGKVVLVVAALLYALSVVVGWWVPAALAVSAVVAVVLAVLVSLRAPRGAVTRRLDPDHVERRGAASGRLELSNDSFFARPAMLVEETVGERSVEVRVPGIPRGGKVDCSYGLPTDRRGLHEVGPVRLVRVDPLGLARVATRVGGTKDLWVHPKIHALGARAPSVRSGLDDSRTDAAEHGSITFHALREYQPGDNPKHIHWASTARTGDILVRQHIDTSLPQLSVGLDLCVERFGDDELLEEAVDAAASLIVAAIDDGYPVGLHVSDGSYVKSRGDGADRRRFLDHLTTVAATPAEQGLARLAESLSRAGRGATLCLVGGSFGTGDMRAVRTMAGRFRSTVVISVTGRSWQLPLRQRNIATLEVADAAELASRWSEVSLR